MKSNLETNIPLISLLIDEDFIKQTSKYKKKSQKLKFFTLFYHLILYITVWI